MNKYNFSESYFSDDSIKMNRWLNYPMFGPSDLRVPSGVEDSDALMHAFNGTLPLMTSSFI